MSQNLDQMSKEQLLDLKKDVEKALASVDARRKAEARVAAEKAIEEYGYSLDEITERPTTQKGNKNPPKYRNPDNHSQMWSGRGRQPAWVKEALDNGKSLEDLLIASSRKTKG